MVTLAAGQLQQRQQQRLISNTACRVQSTWAAVTSVECGAFGSSLHKGLLACLLVQTAHVPAVLSAACDV
mgnify:CR=1 FL=1